MKRIIIIIAFLALFSSAKSQFIIKQSLGLEIYEHNHLRLNDTFLNTKLSFDRGDFGFKYKFNIKFKNLSLISYTDVYMDKGMGMEFDPLNVTFRIDLRYDYKKLCLIVSHVCMHPIEADRISHYVHMQGGYTRIGLYYNW